MPRHTTAAAAVTTTAAHCSPNRFYQTATTAPLSLWRWPPTLIAPPRPCHPSEGEIRRCATEWRGSRAREGRDRAHRPRGTATSPAIMGTLRSKKRFSVFFQANIFLSAFLVENCLNLFFPDLCGFPRAVLRSRSRFFFWSVPGAGAAFFKATPAASFRQAKNKSLVLVIKSSLEGSKKDL